MKSNVRDWLIGVAGCLLLAAAWGILAVPGTAVADKAIDGVHNHGGDDGGGGGTSKTPCLTFYDILGDNIQSDDGTPYCHDKKAKIEVSFTNDGHLNFDTNNSNKTGVGRSLYIDFGEPITIIDNEGQPQTFQSTTELDLAGIEHDLNMSVGAFQGDFDMLNMGVNETRTDVNLQMRLFIHFQGQSQETGVRIALAPIPIDNDRHCPGSDSVVVTYLGVNADGLRAWRIGPAVDDDGDGTYNEDRIDGIDNDNDGSIDEDPPIGLACVTQNNFATDTGDVFFQHLQFEFTVTAP